MISEIKLINKNVYVVIFLMKGLCIYNDGNLLSLIIYIVYYINCLFLYILLIRWLCDLMFKYIVKLFMFYFL